jgi:lycopene beta-cyclase
MQKNHYDYIIVGNGMAGLKIALAFSQDDFFKEKQIALIDYSNKDANDKTWCFWDTSPKQWKHIISKQWHKTNFYTSSSKTEIDLSPYKYNMIRAIDFYNSAKTALKAHPNIHFIKDTISAIEEQDSVCSVNSKNHTYTANHIFDSRIPEDYTLSKSKHINIHQHFKGWVINTEEDTFTPDTFTVMDYRVPYKNATAFTYVVPFTKTSALVEFTFFTPFTVDNSTYDEYLKNYIENVLNIKNYTISEEEQGVIPMTDFPFHKYNTKRITKIGTAGGWVKPSSGYAFKLSDAKVAKLVENIKAKKNPSQGLINKKFTFYDKVFLRVLHDENHKGEWIFKNFYSKNSVHTMFNFLDETSSYKQDFKIMSSLFSFAFIKAFFKSLY